VLLAVGVGAHHGLTGALGRPAGEASARLVGVDGAVGVRPRGHLGRRLLVLPFVAVQRNLLLRAPPGEWVDPRSARRRVQRRAQL